MFELNDRIAFVTGGARGIGREIVLTLARQGAAVVAADLNTEGLEETVAIGSKEGLRVFRTKLDVTSPEDWAAAMAYVGSEFKKLDILVNNAGMMKSNHFFDTTVEEYRKTMQVNAESMFIGVKAAYSLLIEGGKTSPAGSSVVNMSSVNGQVAGSMNVPYCTSKAAVLMMTKALAVDLGQAGTKIRVNSVHPGAVDTTMLRIGCQAYIDSGALPNMAAVDKWVEAATPLGRLAKVDDIAGVVAFLASDASKYMTGSEVTVDGGYSII